MKTRPILLALGFALATSMCPAASTEGKDAPRSISNDDLRRFVGVFRAVQNQYVTDVSDKQLMDAAIRGLLSDLDPHSAYMDSAQFEQSNDDISGDYAGIGIEVQIRDGALKIVAPIDGTPAARAALQAGDQIIRIDGIELSSEALPTALDSLRGPPGSAVTLTIQRGLDAARDVKLVRERIQVDAVQARRLDGNLGYARIAVFQENVGKKLGDKLQALQKESPLDGLILDLRSNPGGLLDEAVSVADLFLGQGLIVRTEGRDPSATLALNATAGDVLADKPLVVLIDAGSASASEIVAGALKDHERAILVGARSFGKGSVQTILPLKNGDGLKLTTAYYYTPSGTSIQRDGISPDVPVADLQLRPADPEIAPTREASLPGNLANPTGDHAITDLQTLATDDYALHEALQILRTMRLLGARQSGKSRR